ncbi:MAG: hypothetical protein GPJ51_08855 [Candidatus Heimdallarchaeota archaeon]|nr:hypothetical protein [Candidatus Heimdallarchaeota archaeon]
MSIEEKEEEIIIAKQATRFGWKDFIVNLLFSLIMISSFVVFVIWDSPASDDITDWLLRIAVTILPLFIFVNRTIKEFFYIKDFIKIVGVEIHYRSTPLLMTGYRTKKGKILVKEIRRYGLSRIPRKLSLDMWRKYRNKAMLVIQLRSGKEFFVGEFISNEDLSEIVLHIKHMHPKAKYSSNLREEIPELAKKEKELIKSKKVKKLEDFDDEPEGTGYRKR